MVMALLAGTKTQTRRIVKPQPDTSDGRPLEVSYGWPGLARSGMEYHNITPPYGRPGDVLWVRETLYYDDHSGDEWCYQAGHEIVECDFTGILAQPNKKAIPSNHMPFIACRLFLQINSVRVERLQDISETDAIAEGVYCYSLDDPDQTDYKNYLHKGDDDWGLPAAVKSYETLWQKINGPESWQANPYVWVVDFEKVDKPSAM